MERNDLHKQLSLRIIIQLIHQDGILLVSIRSFDCLIFDVAVQAFAQGHEVTKELVATLQGSSVPHDDLEQGPESEKLQWARAKLGHVPSSVFSHELEKIGNFLQNVHTN